MIHLSIRNPIERDKEVKKLKAKKYVYYIHYSGLHDKDILNLKRGDLIIGRLSLAQMFLPKVDVELFVPMDGGYQRFLLTEVSLEGTKPCLIFLGNVDDI